MKSRLAPGFSTLLHLRAVLGVRGEVGLTAEARRRTLLDRPDPEP